MKTCDREKRIAWRNFACIGEKWGKLRISCFLGSKRDSAPTKIDANKLDLKFIKRKSYIWFQLNMSKHVGGKCEKLFISSIRKGTKPLRKLTQIDDTRMWTVVHSKWYATFQLNVSTHVEEKCEKLFKHKFFSYILSPKWGITPSKIDALRIVTIL